MARHGEQGNNWLYIMRAHADRLMFGTDALAVGIKAHGDAAYAMNARAMYPIFDILDEAAKHNIPGAAGITDKIGRTNYEKIFHDPEITTRRHAWENYLATEKTAEHSAHASPQQFTTNQTNPLLTAAETLEQRERRVKSLVEHYRHLNTNVTHRTETGRWTDERAELHTQIVDDVYSRHPHVPSQRRAIMAGGLPGAGKTTTIRTHAGVDLDDYIVVNPDVMKTELIERNALPSIPDGDVAPMELSPLIHEESSHLAIMLAFRAYAEGKNVIWDIGMTNRPSTEQRVTELLEHGYRLRGFFVDVPIPVSMQRATERYRKEMEQYFKGIGYGGRPIPLEFLNKLQLPDGGSRNREVFEQLRERFDDWLVYDNSGKAPRVVERKKHTGDSQAHQPQADDGAVPAGDVVLDMPALLPVSAVLPGQVAAAEDECVGRWRIWTGCSRR